MLTVGFLLLCVGHGISQDFNPGPVHVVYPNQPYYINPEQAGYQKEYHSRQHESDYPSRYHPGQSPNGPVSTGQAQKVLPVWLPEAPPLQSNPYGFQAQPENPPSNPEYPNRYEPNPQVQNDQPNPINKLQSRVKSKEDTRFSSNSDSRGISSRFNVGQTMNTTEPEDDKRTDSLTPMLGSKIGEMYDRALEAITAVAIRLEALLSKTNLKNSRNFLVSPLSMAVAVGELLLGAHGPFKSHLYDLVVFKNPNETYSSSVRHSADSDVDYKEFHEQLGLLMNSLEEEDAGYKLRTASIIYAQETVRIKQKYADDVKRFYGTEIKPIDFARKPTESQRIINEWVRRSTNNLIKELLPGPLPTYTHAILANAVYFKADWEVPFASEINRQGVFKTSPTETVNVTFMIGEFENYQFVENKQIGCRMVKIPYVDQKVAMYIILPNPGNGRNEYDINSFVQELKMEDFDLLTDNVQERKVTMVLPKMSLSNIISMIEPLRQYHKLKEMAPKRQHLPNSPIAATEEVTRQFFNMSGRIPSNRNSNLRIDLSEMFENPRHTLNNIYQQMTLSVNEKGTEAAAISAGIVDYIMDSVVFRVDRPFLFFIRHEDTKAILFWGTIVDPSEARVF